MISFQVPKAFTRSLKGLNTTKSLNKSFLYIQNLNFSLASDIGNAEKRYEFNNLVDMMNTSCELYPNRNAFGTRIPGKPEFEVIFQSFSTKIID